MAVGKKNMLNKHFIPSLLSPKKMIQNIWLVIAFRGQEELFQNLDVTGVMEKVFGASKNIY